VHSLFVFFLFPVFLNGFAPLTLLPPSLPQVAAFSIIGTFGGSYFPCPPKSAPFRFFFFSIISYLSTVQETKPPLPIIFLHERFIPGIFTPCFFSQDHYPLDGFFSCLVLAFSPIGPDPSPEFFLIFSYPFSFF